MLFFQKAIQRCDAVYRKGGSSNTGAKEQAQATNRAIDLQRDQWEQIQQNLEPFLNVGAPALNQLVGLSSLEGQGQALNDYYKSDQYKAMADQARYQSLAAAEATGGLGGSATQNQLAAIAPALGQNFLAGQMQNYGNLASIGMNAATGQATAGQNYANNTGNLLGQLGAANAAASQRSGGGVGGFIGGAASGALSGAALGSVVPGIGNVAGAVGGGILGGLSSLF